MKFPTKTEHKAKKVISIHSSIYRIFAVLIAHISRHGQIFVKRPRAGSPIKINAACLTSFPGTTFVLYADKYPVRLNFVNERIFE